MNLSSMRSALAAALSLSLIVTAPGSSAYAAFTKQAPAQKGAAIVVAPQVSTIPSSLVNGQFAIPKFTNVSVTGTTSNPGAAAAQPVALQQNAVTSTIPGAFTATQPGAQQKIVTLGAQSAITPTSSNPGVVVGQDVSGQTLTQRLNAELPDLSNVSDSSAKEQSGADFAKRIGETTIVAEGATPDVAAGVATTNKTSLKPSTGKKSILSRFIPSGLKSAALSAQTSKPVMVFAAAFGAAAMGLGLGRIGETLLVFPLLIVSLILHEMGHAKVASMLGDQTGRLQGKLSFKPSDLKTHIDPIWTIALPLFTMLQSGFIFGGARPVIVNTRNFKDPKRDMALVGLAGPAVNLILAAVGALAFAGLGAIGAAPLLVSIAGTFTLLNVMLAIFNLIPAYPFDGHHIMRWLLPERLADKLDDFYANGRYLAWIPGVVFVLLGMQLGVFAALNSMVASVLVTGAAALVGMIGQIKDVAPTNPGPATPVTVASSNQEPSTELVVILDGSSKILPEDAHLSFVDVAAVDGVSLYEDTQRRMLAALADAGLPAEELAAYNATPVATYKRINAATLRLDAAKAQAFADALRAKGHRVFPNSERRIIVPVPVNPEDADPNARGSISMDDNLAITNATSVHAIAAKKWGNPGGEGKIRGFLRKLFGGETAPQTPVAVVDTGADIRHPLLKTGVKIRNATSADDADDNGHGTWVTSMVRNFAKWNNNVTSYKTFVNGGATLDDILKALTSAANDGNVVISNSWGSDDGDPNSPDSELVRKLAQEGHIMVFAAGNAGSRPNTIGSPAIVVHRTADGTPRVVSVAAAGRDKKIAYFSSRGPGSPKTKSDPNYPKRPDLTALGYNTDGAWLTDGGADRIDPVKGPIKAISGTSMSTPGVAGAIVLLAQLFNVTSVGPRLDAVVKAVMDTLEKTGQSRDAEGEGFINVEAAYKVLAAAFGPAPETRKLWRLFRK